MSSLKPAITVPNYELTAELAVSGRFILYRGLRTEDQIPVLLKSPRNESQSAVEAELLEREFQILGELVIEGVPRAYQMVRRDGRRWLVLEDRGGVPLASLRESHAGDLDFILKTAIQLAAILSRLHRQGIIHRNINPASVLVNETAGEVVLTDFGFASGGANESHWQLAKQSSSDALPYVSPEQTGRMNRAVDYRTDFYSLGITLYELLTGTTPFRSTDPLEIIHGHIAKVPAAPADVEPAIPVAVSEIVMKLLSKNATNRYQSALGLKEDLEVCAARWTAQRRIGSFELGARDVPDSFVISQQLYGRDFELERLLGAFDRVCEGPVATASMMLVSGYAGIGKTSLIQELYKPIVRQRGYFIAGKVDQIARSTPFGALIQAFRGFIHQLLIESETRLDEWRSKLARALNANGGVIAEVIPEIELILGKQAPAPALGPTEAQNRFRLVFQNFVGAIAHKDHPLVIFLDDLQWADSATLNLFQPLLTSSDIRYLFLIGAYRDNEVDSGHPLMHALDALELEGVKIERVTLRPLELSDLIHLIQDTLHCEVREAESLARLVSQKTEGNPFFVTQFLMALRQEKLIDFDYDKGHWIFKLDAIANTVITDNVVDLMTRKIQRLSAKAQEALTLGACIGNQFDLGTLAVVSQQSSDAAAEDLGEALDEGLIVPAPAEPGWRTEEDPQSAVLNSQSYAFLHDRVQQAAYALIPENARQLVHLRVGRLLLDRADLEHTDEKLFDIVHHLNFGCGLIEHDSERVALSRLNLSAGRKAKSSTAFEAALHYFEVGISLIDEAQWATEYELAFALNLEAGECQYLCGNFDEAEQRFKALLERARTSLDKAMVYRLRMVQYENMSRYADALAVAGDSLALFGVSFPVSTEGKQAALDDEIQSIQSLLGKRSIESLIDLPVMADPETRMVMNILTDIWSSSYILGDALLARLISATMVRLSLAQGNSEESAYGYVTHAITMGPVLGDYESAYEFGTLALRVNERFNDSRRRAKINQQFHAHVCLWRRPMQECIPYAQEARRSGLESGDFLYAAYGASTESWPAIISTQNLAQFMRHFIPNLELIQRLRIVSFADSLKMIMNWARALRGETESPVSLTDKDFEENDYIETYRDNSFFTLFHAVVKLHLFYNFGEYEKALEIARAVHGIAHQLTGMIWTVLFDFWNGLTLAAQYVEATEDERKAYLGGIQGAQKSFSVLAESCPENFLCHSLLLSAEAERVIGNEFSAQGLYDQAVRYAAKTGVLQHQALANELYARFWLERGAEEIASVFMAESRTCYLQWGATAKVAHLDRQYSGLFERLSSIGATPAENFDVETAIKAAQAIAREIDLEKLLVRLMSIAIENAGAERGCLILEQAGQAFVQAEGTKDAVKVNITDATQLDRSTDLSRGIVNYVRRTLESVVLADACHDDLYAADEYVVRRQPRSILCTPVLKQGRLIGALYLENNLVSGAFTGDRIKLLQLLSSEAAVSIENARLYENMKQEAVQRRQAEETLRSVVEGTAAVTGGDFFAALVKHLAAAIGVRYAFVTQCTDQTKTRLRTLAFWAGGSLADNIEYDLALTPCEAVIGGQLCHHPRRLQQLFPGDTELAPMEAESFIGIPMCDDSGEIMGHLAVIDDRPMPDAAGAMSLLKIFAARAGAEFQRIKAEEGLRQALAEVEHLKNRLHAENIYLQEEIQGQHNFGEIVGTSRALLSVLSELERVAPTDSTVLISGETGTGKELIARAIHDRSKRKNHPLVKVNCGAISAGLVESELFGHVKGAFTGAIDRRTGRFELADGGTLFLDEVSELPLETQVKLLRVLQEGEFEPVGSSRTVRVNVRIIAATNRNLDEAARAGRFRSDLFYRLNVFPLHVPPLRERNSDIAQLAMFFLSRFAKKFGKRMDGVSQETMELLIRYPWPGNIRELQNVIERGVVLAQAPVLTLDPQVFQDQSGSLRNATMPNTYGVSSQVKPTAIKPSSASPTTLEDVERQHILVVLEQSRWVIEGPQGAAVLLNLHPNTLRSRMKKLGIHRPARESKRAPHEIS